MKKFLFLILTVCLASFSVMGQERAKDRHELDSVAFYNLENLFDTIHVEGKNDYDFFPDGRYAWGTKKYEAKLKNLSRVRSEL